MSLFKILNRNKKIEPIYNKEGKRMEISELGLTGRIERALNDYGLHYVDELVIMKRVDIVNLRYMDLWSAKEIEEKLVEKGFSFQSDD